jgi:membrane protein required for colicin V production
MLAEELFGVQTNWVDILTLVVLCAFFIYGAIRGFLIQLMGIGVLIGALIVARLLMDSAGGWMHGQWEALALRTARWIAFVVIALAILILGTWLAHMLRDVLKRAKALAFDGLLGGLLGALKGLLIIIVLLWAFLAFANRREEEKVRGISADIMESRTSRIAEWTTEKVLVFLPQDMREWVKRHTTAPTGED